MQLMIVAFLFAVEGFKPRWPYRAFISHGSWAPSQRCFAESFTSMFDFVFIDIESIGK